MKAHSIYQRAVLAFILILFFGNAFGQKIRIPKFHYDTAYIESYDNSLALRVVVPQRFFNVAIRNNETGAKYTYRPNLRFGLGVGFSYRWLAMDFTISPKGTGRNNDKFGETSQFNLNASAYLTRNVISMSFRHYEGAYITNPQDYLPDWDSSQARPLRPDFKTTAFNLKYIIPFNWKRYSFRTTMLLDGRLKKSSGSVMAYSSLYYLNVNADSTLLPSEYAGSFPDEASISKMNIVMLSQSIGYTYTFVIKRFYFTVSAYPSISFNLGEIESGAGKYGPNPVSFKLMSVNGVGFNSRRWYTGLYFTFDNNFVSLPYDLRLANNLGQWRIFVGYRIKAPKVMQKYVY
jgi:hypothetical protein